jgi:hypothetical protein
MSIGLTVDLSSNLKLELSFTQSLCEIIDTPRALTVWLLIENHEYDQLADLTCNPLHYCHHHLYADDVLVTDVMRKSQFLPLEVDKHEAALASFYKAERRCGQVNRRLAQSKIGDLPPDLERARSIIWDILGPLTESDLSFVEDHFRFGPGSTTAVPGVGSVTSDKFDADMHLTYGLIPFYRSLLGDTWWEHQANPKIVEGNKFTTVPKTSKTDRGICVEPTLNIFTQLGIGALIRDKLRDFGINLNSQTRNQYLAKHAYFWGLATIDLAAASDSLAYMTVVSLLPPRWVELLEIARSPKTLVEGVWVSLEKYSSMGNGFTFELESLIFAAVAYACCGSMKNLAVYGDDIIVPVAKSQRVIEALEFLGFSVNYSKSFLAGCFFESCGEDYFMGQPVRAFFLRQSEDSPLPYILQIANALRIYAHKRNHGFGCDSRFRGLWLACYKAVPEPWRRCKVPVTLGDTGVIVSLAECKSVRRPRKSNVAGIEGIEVRSVKLCPRKAKKDSLGLYIYMLQRAGRSETASLGAEPRRGLYGRFVLGWTLITEWPVGFEWLI